jgi:hypothetical protein
MMHTDNSNDQSVAEHLREVQDIPVCKQPDVVVERIGLREECIDIRTWFCSETCQDDPENRQHPYSCKNSQQNMYDEIADSLAERLLFSFAFSTFAVSHQLNAPSSL